MVESCRHTIPLTARNMHIINIMYKINLVKALTPLRTSLSPVVPNFGSAKQKAHGTVSTSQFEI